MNKSEWDSATTGKRLDAIRSGCDAFVSWSEEDVSEWTFRRYHMELAKDSARVQALRIRGALKYWLMGN